MSEGSRIQPCLWFDADLEEAADFYSRAFPDSRVKRVNRSPADWPAGKKGEVITVEMEILGQPFLLLAGGSAFSPTPATSFMVVTADQDETDRYWDAIIENGGSPMACGWCTDRYGFAWQITPQRLLDLLAAEGETAARAFEAMNQMVRIDVEALDRAVEEAGA